jgi:hypothetical protein
MCRLGGDRGACGREGGLRGMGKWWESARLWVRVRPVQQPIAPHHATARLPLHSGVSSALRLPSPARPCSSTRFMQASGSEPRSEPSAPQRITQWAAISCGAAAGEPVMRRDCAGKEGPAAAAAAVDAVDEELRGIIAASQQDWLPGEIYLLATFMRRAAAFGQLAACCVATRPPPLLPIHPTHPTQTCPSFPLPPTSPGVVDSILKLLLGGADGAVQLALEPPHQPQVGCARRSKKKCRSPRPVRKKKFLGRVHRQPFTAFTS